MNDDFNNDEMNETEEPTTMQKVKEWVQENLRIIVSVLIVFLIASSIYSYSKRGAEETDKVAEENSEIENILTDLSSEENTDSKEVATNENAEKTTDVENEAATPEKKVEEPKQETVQKTVETKETENSFVEVAQKGEGTTHLARRALAHYLEKNADSSLTNEHKIYIEDYLRKNISTKGHLMVGNSVEFSKDLIRQAINASKGLNDAQLKNLQKYSANVNF